MMRVKRLLAMGLSLAVLAGSMAVLPAEAAKKGTISRVGSKSRTVRVGSEFDLEVRRNGVRESKCYWRIGDSSILRFEDSDRSERYDDEIELVAKKAGTTKVSCENLTTGGKIYYTITVKKSSMTISRVGSSSRTVRVGNDFELEVRKNGSMSDSKIKWYIGDSSILAFEDGDRYGDDVELIAKKSGTTTVKAKNLYTGGAISYKITVKAASKTISRVGSSSKTVRLGDDIDIEVRKNGSIRDDEIKWYIGDSSILAFEDGDRYGDDVEVIGKKSGTTTVKAKNLYTGGYITYNVTVK